MEGLSRTRICRISFLCLLPPRGQREAFYLISCRSAEVPLCDRPPIIFLVTPLYHLATRRPHIFLQLPLSVEMIVPMERLIDSFLTLPCRLTRGNFLLLFIFLLVLLLPLPLRPFPPPHHPRHHHILLMSFRPPPPTPLLL
ncbi:hypothetical protein KC356_g64 [Hortaea werneckii]|nr:hypothetical protein KC356_g64 [Hortaea werneckii]